MRHVLAPAPLGDDCTHLLKDQLELAGHEFVRVPLDFEVDVDIDGVVPPNSVIFQRHVLGTTFLCRILDANCGGLRIWWCGFRRR